jgi:isocitrate dehydrogenase (NAD+)
LSSAAIPKAKYGGRHTVTVLPGDGIGLEMMGYVKEVFRHSHAPIDMEQLTLDHDDKYNDLHNAIQSVKRNGVAIKGNVESRMNRPDIKSRNVEMRNRLDLFANVVHCKSQPGVVTRHPDIDIHIIRQNTEGEYAMLEHENVPGVVESLKIVTQKNTERLCRFAFEYARKNNRKKVTLIHKANIMKITDGLFIQVAESVAADYPDIIHDNMIVDNTCMQLVSNPWQFDVLVMTNLYGTIVTNLVCGLIGGPGIVSGGNVGPYYAIFEPATRSTGTNLAENAANPSAMLNAAADMLYHLQLNTHGELIKQAVSDTLNVDKVHTADLGGGASARDVVDNVKRRIDENLLKSKCW